MTACQHAKTGRVTSLPDLGLTNAQHAATRVCDLPGCIAEALAWVQRVSGRTARHIPDGGVR